MNASVFIATSLDGFIARENGDLDWLPSPEGIEDYGYRAFMKTIDTIVMGRNTYDKALTFGAWPYRKQRAVVLTTRPFDRPAGIGGKVEAMAGEPSDIVAKLAGHGATGLYIDGGATIQRFLNAGAIQRLIITTVPVLIGRGIPLFASLERDVRLEHVATRSWANGLVQSEYRVVA